MKTRPVVNEQRAAREPERRQGAAPARPRGGRGRAAAVKRAVLVAVVRQFRHPRGMGGKAAGWVMAHRASNRQRNTWVVSLLEVRPTDRVLEVGFGPGIAIAELSRHVGDGGHISGIDHSSVMLRQASRRNASAIAAGR